MIKKYAKLNIIFTFILILEITVLALLVEAYEDITLLVIGLYLAL